MGNISQTSADPLFRLQVHLFELIELAAHQTSLYRNLLNELVVSVGPSYFLLIRIAIFAKDLANAFQALLYVGN